MYEFVLYVLSLFFAVAIPLYILAPILPDILHIRLGGSKRSVLRDDYIGFDK